MPNLFLACKPQQRLMKIFQRKFAPKSLLQPEAPITVPALLVMRGGFAPCALPALAGQCVVMEEPCTALQAAPSAPSTHCDPHTPSRGFWRGAEPSRHVDSEAGDSARTHDLCFSFSRPVETLFMPRKQNPPSSLAQAEQKAKQRVFCCLILEAELS